MNEETITLFLADDHQILIEGITALVANDPSIQIIGHCNDGVQLLDRVQTAKPDVLVLDISLPGVNGLDLCRLVKAKVPETTILMLTMHSNEKCILTAFENGASGYLIKETVSREFCEAVHAVARGELYLGQEIPRSIMNKIDRKEPDPYETLTDQERNVLQLLTEGKSNRQIAEALQISSDTVDSDRENIMQKLGLHSQIELVKYGIRRHLVTLS
jgi:DNA-binding NarL/FixJ family response regulator